MRKRILIAVVVVVLLAVSLYEIILHTKSNDNVLVVSGRVEANETELSAGIPGRLSRVLIDEGPLPRLPRGKKFCQFPIQ